jgi:LemA protein
VKVAFDVTIVELRLTDAARRADESQARTKERSMKRWVPIAAVVFVVVAMGAWAVSGYNSLVGLEQGVRSAWGQVENVYQRRADLVPNLVETVKAAAAFEKDTFTAVANARAQVGQISAAGVEQITSNPEAMAKFQQAQDGLSSALSRLLVVSERYPDLKATAGFRDLQVQLEGTENRIAVERMRFNESAQAFNTKRQSFPTVIIAGFFGDRFKEKPYFKAQSGADTAPKVKF